MSAIGAHGMAQLRSVKGMNDHFGDQAAGMAVIEATARALAIRCGAQEVRTPILEPKALFVRGVGEGTDIVGKEMYAFTDRDGSELVLRPEATAAVARMLVQHGLTRSEPKGRYFYCGPMFRRERPQKGRYRQFHQIGVEFMGDAHPSCDVEVMALAHALLTDLGLDDVVIEVGSVGCPACRPTYRQVLVDFLTDRLEALCSTCCERTATNPMRVLDCKVAGCRELLQSAPLPLDHLCAECDDHQRAVGEGLAAIGVPFTVNDRLVRGLDYYRRTVFEAVTGALGAQAAVIAGGRYDGLLSQFGGPDAPAVGFAAGTERLLLLAEAAGHAAQVARPDLGLVQGPGAAASDLLPLLIGCRAAGLITVADLSGRSVKAQMKALNRAGVRHLIVVGEDEIESGRALVRRTHGEDLGEQPLDPDALAAAL
jgi:histidyl-tRNA synthetase